MNVYLIVSILVILLLVGGMIYLLVNSSATGQKLVKLDATTATVTQISDTINTLQKNLSDSVGKYNVLIETTVPGIKNDLKTFLDGVDDKVNSLSGKVKGLLETTTGIDGRISSTDREVVRLSGAVTGIDNRVTGIDGRVTSLATDVKGIDGRVSSLATDVKGIDGRVTSLAGTVKGLPEAVKALQELTATLSTKDSVETVKTTLGEIQTKLNTFLEKDYINILDRIIALEEKDKALEEKDKIFELKFPEIEKALNRIRRELDINTQKDRRYQDNVNKMNRYVDNASNSDRIPNYIKQRIFASSSDDYVRELLALPGMDQMTQYVMSKLSGRYPCIVGKKKPDIIGAMLGSIIDDNIKSGLKEFIDDDLEIIWALLYISSSKTKDKSPLKTTDFPKEFLLVMKYYDIVKVDDTIDYDDVKALFKVVMNSWVYDCKNWTEKLKEIYKDSDALIPLAQRPNRNTCFDLEMVIKSGFEGCITTPAVQQTPPTPTPTPTPTPEPVVPTQQPEPKPVAAAEVKSKKSLVRPPITAVTIPDQMNITNTRYLDPLTPSLTPGVYNKGNISFRITNKNVRSESNTTMKVIDNITRGVIMETGYISFLGDTPDKNVYIDLPGNYTITGNESILIDYYGSKGNEVSVTNATITFSNN